MSVQPILDTYNAKEGLPGLEFETGMVFKTNIKNMHSKMFNLLSGMAISSELVEHLEVYYEQVRKTIVFKKGINQKRDIFITKVPIGSVKISRHIMGVDNIKAKLSQEIAAEPATGSPNLMRFKLRIKFDLGKKWTAELDLVKEIKHMSVDLKSIKDTVFKPYSMDNILNSIEYSIFDEMRLEFEYSGNLTIQEMFDPINLIASNLNEVSDYQQKIFDLARHIIFNKKNYLETFRDKSGLKKLLNNVLEVDADLYYKKIQPVLDQSRFYVTDKIDGLRTILRVDRKAFLINNALTEIACRKKQRDVIYIDCELVGNTLYAFDLISFNGVDMSREPFQRRLAALGSAIECVKESIDMDIKMKEFVLLTEDWRNQLRSFYEKKRTYETDGLIFTPNDSSDYSSMKGFKWKPADHATIDFFIRKSGDSYVLMSGASKKDILQFGLNDLGEGKKHAESSLIPVLFSPSNSPHAYQWKGPDGLEGKIGEFLWKDDEWHLTKIRTDRDVELARGEYFGNYFRVAESIWYAVHNPLSFDNLFEAGSGYFAEDNAGLYKAQRGFNSMVKTEILAKCIESLKDNNNLKTVVDLAAGKGQDMARLFKLGVQDAIFVDNDANALQELIKRKHTLSKFVGNRKTKITTVQLDLKANFKTNLKDIKQAYASQPKVSLVICNFALHYFTESFEMFSNFLMLVSNLLEPNGLFVFTAFDGQKVFDLCGENGWDYTEGDVLKYSIKPSYSGSTLEPFGQKVKLILPFSKGQYYEECLVNFKQITKNFEDNEFFAEAIGSFSNWSDSNLSEGERIFAGLYSYAVFRKSLPMKPTVQLPRDVVTGANEIHDGRDTLVNVGMSNFIHISAPEATPLQIEEIVSAFEEFGYRNYDKNKRLKKKIFTFRDYITDTSVAIYDVSKIRDYMQWICKAKTVRVVIADCAEILNGAQEPVIYIRD